MTQSLYDEAMAGVAWYEWRSDDAESGADKEAAATMAAKLRAFAVSIYAAAEAGNEPTIVSLEIV